MDNIPKTIGLIVVLGFAIFLTAVTVGAVWAFIGMLVWNATLPYFGIPQIDFFHAWGLFILTSIFVKSFSISTTQKYNAHG